MNWFKNFFGKRQWKDDKENNWKEKVMALAVTQNQDITESDVRAIIEKEVARSPQYQRAADAIDCVRIGHMNINPTRYSQEVAEMYMMSMRTQGWKSVNNLHIFEYLEQPPIYIGFPI